MKVRFERETLLAQLKPLDRMIGTERRETKEEFATLDAQNGSIVWEGTGQESEARKRHSTEGATIEEEGTVDLRARLIVDIAEKTPKGGYITVIWDKTIEGRTQAAGICADVVIHATGNDGKWKGAKFIVNRLVENRERFENEHTKEWATVKGKTLKAMLSACETDAKGNRGKTNIEYFREGVRIERVSGMLRCTSTDMNDITWSETDEVLFHQPARESEDEQWTIKARSGIELRDLLPDGEEEVTIVCEETQGGGNIVKRIGIVSTTTEWKTGVIALKYPATGALIERVRASKATGSASVERKDLKRAATMCRIGDGEERDTQMEMSKTGMRVRTHGNDYSEDMIECTTQKGTIPHLLMNARRLAEITDILNSEEITLSYVETPRKVLIASETRADAEGLGAITYWMGGVTSAQNTEVTE